jgi:pimeloyl-ACP methyl ester carboxylesterase
MSPPSSIRNAELPVTKKPGAITDGVNYCRAETTYINELKNHEGSPTMYDSLPRIEVPTLVIWDEKDTALLPRCLEGLEKYVTNLTVKRIPDADHGIVRKKSSYKIYFENSEQLPPLHPLGNF